MLSRIERWLTVDHPDENIRRQGRMLVIIIVAMTGVVLLTSINGLLSNRVWSTISTFVFAISVNVVIVLLARRGHVTAGSSIILSAMILAIINGMATSAPSSEGAYFLVFPLLTAGLVLRPNQIWAILVIALVAFFGGSVFIDRGVFTTTVGQTTAGNVSVFLFGATCFSYLGAKGTMVALRTAWMSQRTAENVSGQLEQANALLELRVHERTAALSESLRVVEERESHLARMLAENDQQRSVIRDMSLPIIPVNATTLVMPLVGTLDATRLEDMQTHALRVLEQSSARRLVLDITGVPIIDSHVAQGLVTVIHSARLLGAEVILVGVRPEVAQTMVSLGIELRHVRIFSDLQSALGAMS